MKQKKYYNHKKKGFPFFILLLSLVLFSCNKYLDKKSNSSLTTPASISDAQGLMDDATYLNQQVTPSFGEASSDECFLSDIDYNASSIKYQQAYIWEYFPDAGSDWFEGYRPISNAGLAMDIIKNIPETPSNKEARNNVMGSALFFRSYHFLCLLWNYGKAYDSSTANKDLGIVLKLTSDFNIPSIRASNKQCYEQVINDAKKAIPLLPEYPLHVFRPSKGAAYGLLARCYLSMRDYKDALVYADSCLQLNNQLIDYNSNDDFNGSISASYPFKQFNKETIFYTEMNLEFSSLVLTISKPKIDTSLYNAYDTTDLRKQAYFSPGSNGYPAFKGSYAGSYYLFTGIATDEMYLTRAECLIRVGNIQQGLDDLNTLLAKRYKTGTYTAAFGISKDSALTLVLNERRKELVQRGLRWMDIKRLNKENAAIIIKRVINGKQYTLQPNTAFYALPIPDDIIKLNNMEQN